VAGSTARCLAEPCTALQKGDGLLSFAEIIMG
jgi:hypothetical protein